MPMLDVADLLKNRAKRTAVWRGENGMGESIGPKVGGTGQPT